MGGFSDTRNVDCGCHHGGSEGGEGAAAKRVLGKMRAYMRCQSDVRETRPSLSGSDSCLTRYLIFRHLLHARPSLGCPRSCDTDSPRFLRANVDHAHQTVIHPHVLPLDPGVRLYSATFTTV